jgi:hypothetical protein
MTDNERTELAREKAKVIVEQLKAGNERAARMGAPTVEESSYRGLEKKIARKLLRAS